MSDDAEDRMKHKAEGGRSGVTGNRPGWWGRAWRGMMISNHASDFARAIEHHGQSKRRVKKEGSVRSRRHGNVVWFGLDTGMDFGSRTEMFCGNRAISSSTTA